MSWGGCLRTTKCVQILTGWANTLRPLERSKPIWYNQFWLAVGSCALVVQARRYNHCIAGKNSSLRPPDDKNKAHKHHMYISMHWECKSQGTSAHPRLLTPHYVLVATKDSNVLLIQSSFIKKRKIYWCKYIAIARILFLLSKAIETSEDCQEKC